MDRDLNTVDPTIDTVRLIFDDVYLVRIPAIDMRSVEDIKQYGTRISGDKDVDKEMAKAFITTWLPISDIVDYHRKGATVKLANINDIKKIYHAITCHLAAWRDRSAYTLNLKTGPYEDLLAMDNFAAEIYDKAKYHFTPESVDSGLHQALDDLLGFKPTMPANIPAHIAGVHQIDNGAVAEPVVYEDRQSFSEILRENLGQYRQWNK